METFDVKMIEAAQYLAHFHVHKAQAALEQVHRHLEAVKDSVVADGLASEFSVNELALLAFDVEEQLKEALGFADIIMQAADEYRFKQFPDDFDADALEFDHD